MIRNIILLLILLCWFGPAVQAQQIAYDSNARPFINEAFLLKAKMKTDRPVSPGKKSAGASIVTDLPLVMDFCDDDLDGFVLINIDSLNAEVLRQAGQSGNATEAILVSTLDGRIQKVNDIAGTPFLTYICDPVSQPTFLADIGVNKNREIFICSAANIFAVDSNTCISQLLLTTSLTGSINSLSFDRQDNMYFGGGSTKVFRCDAGTLTPVIWHDFLTGFPGGDFVMVGDKMYIAWVLGGTNFRLFEVTVDANMNYVSHVDLGGLPSGTYGLASEYGKLYGVTTTELFRIDIQPAGFVITYILTNPTLSPWGGAAGLHEAVTFNVLAFETLADAQALTNPLPAQWTNTIPGGQTIYVAIINQVTGDVQIVPVQIIVHITPVDAGPDQNICNTISTVTMAANIPSAGSGQWTLQSGTGTISNPADPLTTVTGMQPGDNIFRWTITNGACVAYDTVKIHVDPVFIPLFSSLPDICEGAVPAVLPGTSLNGIHGTWSPATVSNTASGTYTFTPLAGECAPPVQLVQVVIPKQVPLFNTLPAICSGATAPLLPGTSLNGISGTWSPATVSNTVTTTYTFTSNAAPCITPVQLTQVVIPKATPQFNNLPDICSGTTPPVLPATSLNGISGTWNPPVVSNTTSGNYVFTPLASECAIPVQLSQKVNPSKASFRPLRPICRGDAVPVLAAVSIEGVHGTWLPPVVSNTNTATYTFNPDPGGCAQQPFQLTQVVNPLPPAFAGNDGLAAIGLPYQLQASGGIAYQWTPGSPLLDNPFIANPRAVIMTPTNFTVKVTDANGCSASDDVYLKLYKGTTYYIPNAFTPNGDGLNDVFKAIPAGIASTSYFNIYNRWGQMVFSTTDLSVGWDGTWSGIRQLPGTYTWTIRGIATDGKPVHMKGTVQLIR